MKLGTLTITGMAADQEGLSRSLLFLPNNAPAGIEPARSDDRRAQHCPSDLFFGERQRLPRPGARLGKARGAAQRETGARVPQKVGSRRDATATSELSHSSLTRTASKRPVMAGTIRPSCVEYH